MELNYKEGNYAPGHTMEDQFEQLFRSHFKKLHAYACTITRDTACSEEIVQGLFLKLWEKRKDFEIQGNLGSYLYSAVHHESLNYLKHLKVRAAHKSYTMRQANIPDTEATAGKAVLSELEQQLDKALRELPEQCRTIFQLSRFEDLKYRQIADKLGLSVKTVENQMGKALRMLRLKLVDFLPLILPLIMYLIYQIN